MHRCLHVIFEMFWSVSSLSDKLISAFNHKSVFRELYSFIWRDAIESIEKIAVSSVAYSFFSLLLAFGSRNKCTESF